MPSGRCEEPFTGWCRFATGFTIAHFRSHFDPCRVLFPGTSAQIEIYLFTAPEGPTRTAGLMNQMVTKLCYD